MPADVVEEWPVVEAVVVGAVGLGVVRRRHDGHLVAVDGVEAEEQLHLLGSLLGTDALGGDSIYFLLSLKIKEKCTIFRQF